MELILFGLLSVLQNLVVAQDPFSTMLNLNDLLNKNLASQSSEDRKLSYCKKIESQKNLSERKCDDSMYKGCYENSEKICNNTAILVYPYCLNYITCIENSTTTTTTISPNELIQKTVEKAEAEDVNDVNDPNNLQYIWLIIIPLIIFFGIGKFLYERRHNSVINHCDDGTFKTVPIITKFFEEERKYRGSTNRQDSKELKNMGKFEKVDFQCPKNSYDIDGVCFFESVIIESK